MKRYKQKVIFGIASQLYKVESYQHPQGEWVKYEDVKGLFQYKDQLRNLGVTLESENKECNCLREAEQPTGLRLRDRVCYDCWICPVHGYKKI